VSVEAARLPRWVEGFATRHGGVRARRAGDEVILAAGDGSRAVLTVPFPPLPCAADAAAAGANGTRVESIVGADDADAESIVGADGADAESMNIVASLVEHAEAPRTVLALLVRRGGFACAVLADGRVTASAVGRRHVQGRTAAGGWSQQRFARRREQQADRLVDAAVEAAAGLLVPAAGSADVLVTGGDKPLVARSLADRRLAGLVGLARGPHLEVPDPRPRVVAELPRMVRLVQVRLEEVADPA